MTADRDLAKWVLTVGAFLLVVGCTKPKLATTPGSRPAAKVSEPADSAVPGALDAQALQSTATTLPSTVTKVTVYSDRARVTRQSTANVSAEPTVFAFRGLPGWVDDGS